VVLALVGSFAISVGTESTAQAALSCTETADPASHGGLQTLLDDVSNAGDPDPVACIPRGTYTVTRSLVVPIPMTVIGSDPIAPTIDCHAATFCFDGSVGPSNVTLSNLVLSGAKKADIQIGLGSGASAAVTGWTLTDITAKGAGQVGIAMNKAANITITGAIIDGNGSTAYDATTNPNGDFGLRASRVDALTITDSVISNNPSTPHPTTGFSGGAKFNTTTNLLVQNNDFTGNAGGGQLWLDISSRDFHVVGNTIEEVPTAGTGALPLDGLRVEVSCAGVNGSVVQDNVVTGGDTAAIDIYDSSGITVRNNTVTVPSGGKFGIRMIGNAHDDVPDNGCQQGGLFPDQNNVATGNAIDLTASATADNGVKNVAPGITSGDVWSDNTYRLRHCDPNPPTAGQWMWWDGASNRSVGYQGWQAYGQDVGGLSTCTSIYPQIDASGPFDPPFGPVGAVVTIHGSGFADMTWVKFNSRLATFTHTDTTITATVPAGTTTGTVCVKNPVNTSCSSANFVIALPATLTVTRSGAGTGTITSLAPSLGINCGATCQADFAQGSSVVLHAAPDGLSSFSGWSGGGCSGTANCTVAMSAARSVDAHFDEAPRALTVATTGNGEGTVRSDTGGIHCPGVCAANFDPHADVELTATSADGSLFSGWSGDCIGTGVCDITMDRAMNVTATFSLDQQTLSVTTHGDGTGVVTSDVDGIDCGDSCSAVFNHGTAVVLTAAPDADMVFEGWGGDCGGRGTCTLTMDDDHDVSATFEPALDLSVAIAGVGSGAVTTPPDDDIDCPGTCSAGFATNSAVTLHAVADAGSILTGWTSGDPGFDCPDASDCVVTMDQVRSVTAIFGLMWTLNVQRADAGGGAITADVGAIDCGATCTDSYADGTVVTLHAADGPNSTFLGWTGDTDGNCPGTANCTVTMDQARTITAIFEAIIDQLSVTKSGTGTGVVTSLAPNTGIDCGDACDFDFDQGTSVVLHAAADAGSNFIGWSGGGCAGTPDCTVSMDTAKTVSAQFDLARRLLAVTKAGNGNGSVTSDDAGNINCPGTCSAFYASGTGVTLTAHLGANATFTGWSGDCSGTGACSVTMDQARNVTATFALVQHVLSVTKAGTGTGTITSNVGGINCLGTCSANYDHGTGVVLTAGPGPNATFAGWSGGVCSGTATTCAVTMDAAKSVTATFALVQHLLSVAKAGTGTGTITSNVGGINCPGTCSATYDHGAAVILTATPSGGSTFAGWTGVCTGTGTCNVTMDAAKAVTGTFNPPITTTTLKDSDDGIAYNGWVGVVEGGANSYRMSNVLNNSATWKSPNTTSITWVTRTGPDQGKVSVTIDGRNKGTFDLYSAAPATLNKVFSGLQNKAHTVIIKVLHTKNNASSNYNVVLDGFKVGATTTQESDPAIQYDTWKSTNQGSATDGTYRSATGASATVTVTFTGTAIDWITTKGKPYGKASVKIDGVSKGTVDLYRSATAWRSLITFAGLASGPHTMVIGVLHQKNGAAKGTAVVVDGFIVHA
jgi:parallel beta-helix repeat protein